jgi:hypothetical protein
VCPRRGGRSWGCRSRPAPIGHPQRRQLEQQGAGMAAAAAGAVAVVGRRAPVAAAAVEVWAPEEDGGHRITAGWCPSRGCRRWASPRREG